MSVTRREPSLVPLAGADEKRVEPHRTAHPDPDTLELYALFRLADPAERKVEQHVWHCPQCQREVVHLAHQAQLIRAALALYVQKPKEPGNGSSARRERTGTGSSSSPTVWCRLPEVVVFWGTGG